AFLARLINAELLLVHIQAPDPFYFEIPEPLLVIQDHAKLDKFIEDKLIEIVRDVESEYGIKPRYTSSTGQIANEIMELAQREKTNLIILGTHGAKGFEELFIGSNAHKIVNLASCPVLTVQAHAMKPGFSNIVLPIDRSLHSREKVGFATALAKVYGAKIHILGLLDDNDVPDIGDEENEFGKLQIVLDQVQHAVEQAGIAYTRHTVQGTHLAAEALKYGTTVNADLIIIMTDHESALTGVFMGPLAKQIVNHSRIPVLSIKPHYGNFESLDLTGGYTAY
ncbi:MAG: universal stress protein, partial [Bacteroidota bacterium]|nr:universal stress protein [Bacteroidota bacterium]